jgi:methionine-rich copper-binding protein CopC
MSIRRPLSGAIVNLSLRGSRTSRVGFAVVAGLVTALLIAATVALGHAELATVTPADKSTVTAPLAEIVMTFTEPVAPANSSIKLVDSSNKVVVDGSTVDAGDAKTMRLAVPSALPPGAYTVRWTTKSALDGDLYHGTTAFTLNAAPSVPPPSPPSASPSAAAASASAAPSASSSIAPAPSASAAPAIPASSTGDAVIPVVVALIVLAGLGLWLLRSRARAR